jgi:hypothetical protein
LKGDLVRALARVVLLLSAILFVAIEAYAEPPAQPRIHFAAVWYDPNIAQSPFLLGAFEFGLNVTLVSGNHTCKASTGYALTIARSEELSIPATKMIELEKCRTDLPLAIVGRGAASVQPLPPQRMPASLPREVEQTARQIVAPDGLTKDYYGVSGSPPEIMRVGRFILLKFSLNGEGEKGNGPAVLFTNGHFFELEGFCGTGHFFFSVSDKPHLSYTENGCGSGRLIFYVYDLSGKTPRIVYSNSDFSV